MIINNLKTKIAILCYLPLLWLTADILLSNLGSNPIQALHIRLGDWALRFLCITLAITPIQTITSWRGMANYRRMFGLFTFAYATLHVLVYLSVDHFFVWQVIAIDIIESPCIWFGVIAYLIIFALALTTSKKSQKYMDKYWKKLHRLIYFAAGAVVTHYFWQLKGNLLEPLFYALIITLLLVFRLLVIIKNRQLARLMIPRGRLVETNNSIE